MKIITREAIDHLIYKTQLSNRSIETYIATIAMSETLGDDVGIINFCPHRLYSYMKRDLNMNWISKSGFYKSFESLRKDNLVAYYPESKQLLVPDLAEHHRLYSRGYITIPLICFKDSFHLLPLGCKKLFLKLFSMIGNNPERKLYYNVLKHKSNLMKMCRLNRCAQLYTYLYKLRSLFTIKALPNLVLEIQLSPILELESEHLPLNLYHSIKTHTKVIKELCSYNYQYSIKELKSICSAIEGFSFLTMRQTLKEYVFNPRKNEIANLKFYIKAVAHEIKSRI